MMAMGFFDAGSFCARDLVDDFHRIGRGAQVVPANFFPGIAGQVGVAIHGSPIAGASSEWGRGFMGPGQLRGSYSIGGFGPIAIAQRYVRPIETHYLVYPRECWLPNAAPIDVFAAKLVQKTKGIFEKKRVSLSWIGGPFAALLDSNRELHDVLWQYLQLDDRLEIRPQPHSRLVRIVHRRMRVIESEFFAVKPPTQATVDHALFSAFEWIAGGVHAWATPS